MESPSFQKLAFDISAIPESVDLSTPPVTGLDYLYRVRLEASNCPKVVVSDIDRTQFLSRQTVTVDICNGFVCARPGFEPDPAWQDEQLETFRTLKADVSKNKEKLMKMFPRIEFPSFNNDEWSVFCLGSELDQNLRTGGKIEEKTDMPLAKKPRMLEKSHPPLLSIVLYLNQPQVIGLLRMQIRWLEKIGFSQGQGEWLYALLVCLEKPLEPNTCSLLRNLSRHCSKLRDELSTHEDEFLMPLNLILSIIAHCFDQKDMSDGFFASES